MSVDGGLLDIFYNFSHALMPSAVIKTNDIWRENGNIQVWKCIVIERSSRLFVNVNTERCNENSSQLKWIDYSKTMICDRNKTSTRSVLIKYWHGFYVDEENSAGRREWCTISAFPGRCQWLPGNQQKILITHSALIYWRNIEGKKTYNDLCCVFCYFETEFIEIARLLASRLACFNSRGPGTATSSSNIAWRSVNCRDLIWNQIIKRAWQICK